MSTSKYKFDYSPYLTILGLIFFGYVFLAGWGTDPSKYSKINDPAMDCKKILEDVDRVGVVQYVLNGKPDANKHYYPKTGQQHQKREINDFRGQQEAQRGQKDHFTAQGAHYSTGQEPLVQDRKTQRAIRKAEKATRKFWNGHHR